MRKNQKEIDKWLVLPKELLRRHGKLLGPVAIAVYAILSAYADEDNRCSLTYRIIHVKLGISNAETIRALHSLEDLGLIKQEVYKRRTYYRLLWVPPWGISGEKAGDKTPNGPGPYRIVNRLNIIIDLVDTLKRKLITTKIMDDENIEDQTFDQEENQIEYPTDETHLAYELAEKLN